MTSRSLMGYCLDCCARAGQERRVAEPNAPSLETELRALDAWWREAGVEHVFFDAPQNWLADPAGEADAGETALAAPASVTEPVPTSPLLAGGPGAWPGTLAEFEAWWLTEPALALGGSRRRVAPRGPADAPLMVLVPQPEAEDGATLPSGAQGALLGNILAAFGLAPDECRIAALIPSHQPHPDWPALDHAGWGALARHHLALARPRRLLALGQVALPLLGHDTAQGPAAFHQVALEGGAVPALAALDLGTLLERPSRQARLWQRWLEWTDGQE
jgi:DNA polymerase